MLNEILMLLGIWFVALFVMFNKLTKGALIQIIKVKMNKKLKLLKVYSLNEIYFTTAKYIDNQLVFKQRHKDKFTKKKDIKNITVTEDKLVYRIFGVDCFEVFEKQNDFKLIEAGTYNTLSSYDATLQDMLVERGIMRPSLKDEEIKNIKMIVIIGVVASGLCVIATIYGIIQTTEVLKAVETLSATSIPIIP
jgi:hypothetical protein